MVAPPDAARALAVLRSALVPSAVDVHWPDRLVLLFEGSERAVAAQVEAARGLIGAEPAGTRSGPRQPSGRPLRAGGSRSRPATSRAWLAAEEEAVVRVGAGVAYVPHEVPDPRGAAEIGLVDRIAAAFA